MSNPDDEKNRPIHKALVKHLGDPKSCKCGDTSGCFRLKQTLSNLGKKANFVRTGTN